MEFINELNIIFYLQQGKHNRSGSYLATKLDPIKSSIGFLLDSATAVKFGWHTTWTWNENFHTTKNVKKKQLQTGCMECFKNVDKAPR